HVLRKRETDGGWSVVPLYGGQSAEQVAAGVAYSGTASAKVYGFFIHEKKLFWTSLGDDGATWSSAKEVSGAAITRLRVAYSPKGRVVLYGANSSGNLVTVFQTGAGSDFISNECATQGLLSDDFQLCMSDEADWTIAANVEGQAYLLTGVLDAKQASSCAKASFSDKLQRVALGYWSSSQNTLIFLLVDGDGALHAWSQGN